MKVKECMSTTSSPEYLGADCSIQEAAQYMNDRNCGFVPLGDNDRLIGIVTDRDIVVRALANGISPEENITKIESPQVLYCYENDDVGAILDNMREQQAQRLIVLDNQEDKDYVGIVTLSDIADRIGNDQGLSQQVVDCCRHYN